MKYNYITRTEIDARKFLSLLRIPQLPRILYNCQLSNNYILNTCPVSHGSSWIV